MSTVDDIREAAALMRSRAEAATPGPWTTECIGSEGWHVFGPSGLDERVPMRRPRTAAVTWGTFESDKADAAHIASWSPTVALAVAGWLDSIRVPTDPHTLAEAESKKCRLCAEYHRALIVARAYLGRAS
jgi:hypothetical protein